MPRSSAFNMFFLSARAIECYSPEDKNIKAQKNVFYTEYDQCYDVAFSQLVEGKSFDHQKEPASFTTL
jgi:hypothetical protein